MNNNGFDNTVASLFKGMDAFVSAKTVVGDAVTINDTIVLPLVDVSFGVGAGAFCGDTKNNAGGGMTGKVTPSAVLVIQNGNTRLVNIKNQDTITKVLDMIPDLVDRFTGKDASKEAPVETVPDVDSVIKRTAAPEVAPAAYSSPAAAKTAPVSAHYSTAKTEDGYVTPAPSYVKPAPGPVNPASSSGNLEF